MDTVGIKYVNNMYIVCKDKKYNLFATAITTENRKIGSAVFLSTKDLTKMHDALEKAKEADHIRFETFIESGKFVLSKECIPCAEGLAIVYNINIEDGKFISKMSDRAYAEFIQSIDANYASLQDPSIKNDFDITKKPKKKPKEVANKKLISIKDYFRKKRRGVFE